ncbi:hypothetical protein D3C73_642090 [compost metagenome]
MHPKRILIVGTMALAITFGFSVWSDETQANGSIHPADQSKSVETKEPTPLSNQFQITHPDDLTQVLGLASDEDVDNALYSGQSLADLADEQQIDVQNIIDLQVSQLNEQLIQRLSSGSLSPSQYVELHSELEDIITQSVHMKMRDS